MDEFDKIIKQELSKNIEVPQSFDNKILYSLKNKKNLRQIKISRIIKTIITTIITIIFSTGVAFAGYILHEKVWKQPTEYNSYEEKENIEREKIELSKKGINNILPTENILEKSNRILQSLGYNDRDLSITLKKSYSAIYNSYYEVKSSNDYFSGIELHFNAEDGNLIYFIDRDIDSNYKIKTDTISVEEAKNIGNKIYSKLELSNNYKLKSINENSTSINSHSRKEWYLKYYMDYDNVLNEYQRLEIRFYINNDDIKISQIAIYDDGFTYQNNQLVINKDDAINIAKEKDRTISELNIRKIDIGLEIKPINEFVYLQENSFGKDDGIVKENSIIYSKYSNEKILRKVWNIKIEYEFNCIEKELIHNWKEQFGREYYVDATTGEIIGGNWGESLLD